jgi:hypothetical protein
LLGHTTAPTFDGVDLATVAAFAGVGFVVVRKQPDNRIGWLLLVAAIFFALNGLGAGYLVLDYREHGGRLPFARAAFAIQPGWLPAMSCVALAVLLFPDGRSPSRRWRWPIRIYCAFGVWFSVVFIVAQAGLQLGHHVPIDWRGNYTGDGGGFSDVTGAAAWVTAPVVLGFWIAFVVRQALAWRTASGERREQLKWLMCGGALSVASIVVVVFSNANVALRLLTDLGVLGIAALPLGIGIGILKYRLYDIDRLISRTIAYAIVTGSLVALFIGVIALTTGVLPFSSPVGVAASTLATAALFNPLRRRVQRTVDRRFNRARYDAEATVDAFVRRLREAVDLETVELGLVDAVGRAVEPAHLSVWIRGGQGSGSGLGPGTTTPAS